MTLPQEYRQGVPTRPVCVVLKAESKALCVLGRDLPTEPHSQPEMLILKHNALHITFDMLFQHKNEHGVVYNTETILYRSHSYRETKLDC